ILSIFFLGYIYHCLTIRFPGIIFITTKWFLRAIKRFVGHYIFFVGGILNRGYEYVLKFSIFPCIPMALVEVVINICVGFLQVGIVIEAGYLFDFDFLVTQYIFSVGRNI